MARIKKKKSTAIKQDVGVNLVIHIILILIAILCMYPIWFVLIASISEPSAIANGDVILLPKKITFAAYAALSKYPEIFMGYRNSLFYMFFGTGITLVGILPCAYALSRKELVGRKLWNTLIVISMYFSGGLISTYLLHKSIGWLDTIWVLVIPGLFTAYYLILARNSFESMPEAMREAAFIDGADDFRYFLQFVLPLSKAMIAVIFLFRALGWWNSYMQFLIYIDTPELQSLQVIVNQITTKLSSALSDGATMGEAIQADKTKELLKYSVVVITALPFCLLYPFIQKYFNTGIMLGSVKE